MIHQTAPGDTPGPGERNQGFVKLYQDPERGKELRENL
ncbi:hypothetical protein LCGC14_1826500, partial [marine sediment metagenome]